jgi:hypothetical protein
MPKEFYTERDIEDLVKRGITSLQLNDQIVLTELAYEKAQRLGLTLISTNAKPPAAPERPYIAKPIIQSQPVIEKKPGDLQTRIRDAVNARLGNQVEPALLDSIIKRVLDSLGSK